MSGDATNCEAPLRFAALIRFESRAESRNHVQRTSHVVHPAGEASGVITYVIDTRLDTRLT